VSGEELAELRAEALVLPDFIDHEGDCAASLCQACGHCLHSIAKCPCHVGGCGCADAIDSTEVIFRRQVIALIDSLTPCPATRPGHPSPTTAEPEEAS
jgi:hypothetical protein